MATGSPVKAVGIWLLAVLGFGAALSSLWLLIGGGVALFGGGWDSEIWAYCILSFIASAVIGLVVAVAIGVESLRTVRDRRIRRDERRHALHELAFTGVDEWGLAGSDRSSERWRRIRRHARASQLMYVGRRTLLFPFVSVGYIAQQVELLKTPFLGWVAFVARSLGILLSQVYSIVKDLFLQPRLILGTIVEVRDVPPDEQESTYGSLLGVSRPGARLSGARVVLLRGFRPAGGEPIGSRWVLMTAKLRLLAEPGDRAVFVVAPGNGQAFSRLALIDREVNST